MDGSGPARGIVGLVGGVLGLLPFILLFVDYRKRGEIHKPLVYLAVFGITMAVVLPFLLGLFGIWLALIAPCAVLVYALLVRSAKR
ncbi:MAG: hypothetical protein KA941_06685 [Flavobacteriales bacterium]|nr:hypothetical protein [Flavobacteriales bacterium]